MYNSNKKWVITIILLIVIILGLSGYIAIDKLLANKNSVKTTQVGEVSIDLGVFSEIDETIAKMNRAFNNSESTYFGYLYSDEEITKNTFAKDARLYLAIYDSLYNTTDGQTIPGGIVKTNFESIFGKKVSYSAKKIEIGKDTTIDYDKATDTYTCNYKTPIKYDVFAPRFFEKSVETLVEEEQITIKRKVFYVEYVAEDGKDINKAKIYKDKDKKTLVATMNLKNNSISVDEVIGKYGTRFSTYTYTFKETAVNEYEFYSVEKTK